MSRHIIRFPLAALIGAILMTMACCTHRSAAWPMLSAADSLMESRPDSALAILHSVDPSALPSGEESARYALLMSMALDKNYVDTTTFDILQPAIDYYLRKGTPDERLRTLYYQGVIHLNRQEYNEAMNSFMNASDLRDEITDSIVLARTLVAQATLYNKQYKIPDLISKSLEAAHLYESLGNFHARLRCYAKAINGYVILNDSISSDSLIQESKDIISSKGLDDKYLISSELSYIVKFGTKEAIRTFLEKNLDFIIEKDDLYDSSTGYSKIGEYDTALKVLSKIQLDNTTADSLRYYSIKYDILDRKGDISNALSTYKKFSVIFQRHTLNLLSDDLLFAEHKHNIEIENNNKLRIKDNLIWSIVMAAILLMLLLCWMYYRNLLNQSRRKLAENEMKRIEEKQKHDEDEAEKMQLEIIRLENERTKLENLLNQKQELTAPLNEVIKARLGMLNSLLAKEISVNAKLVNPYDEQIDRFKKDKMELLSYIKTNLITSVPRFMDHLEKHNLTEEEINFVCLSAIGLNGKEAAHYLSLKRNYDFSGGIRRKLNLDGSETNLGKYVRRLLKELDRPSTISPKDEHTKDNDG